MRIDILTLFPDLCERVMGESILGRAQAKGALEAHCHNIRDYTTNKQKQVDDSPFGGGMGMIMQAQPIVDCFSAVCDMAQGRPHLVYLSPQGRVFDQKKAVELAALPRLALLCGHYEGVDERVIEEIVDEEISIGDFVLTGGELPALMVADAVARLTPGVLSDEECFTQESHYSGLLEYPQYSRPREFHGRTVPEVLLSGHHANIERWRREQMLERTLRKRPDMLATALLDEKDRAYLQTLTQQNEQAE